MLVSETAKALVRQTTDKFIDISGVPAASSGVFPGEIVFGAGGILDLATPPRGVQSKVRRARGYDHVRGGVTSSVSGTIRVLQAWTKGQAITGAIMLNWATTFAAATIVDPVSGLNVVDFFIPVTRELVVVRFTATADLAGEFEMGAFLLPAS